MWRAPLASVKGCQPGARPPARPTSSETEPVAGPTHVPLWAPRSRDSPWTGSAQHRDPRASQPASQTRPGAPLLSSVLLLPASDQPRPPRGVALLSDSLTSHRCVRNRSSSRLQPTSLGLERHRRRLAVRAPPSHSHTPYPRIPPPACHAGPGGARVGRPPAGPMAFARWCVPASLSKVRYYY